MATNVYAWPPFALTGWAIRKDFRQSRSVAVIQGDARTSSAMRPRRKATAIVSGIWPDQSGAGYVEMLNMLWESGPRLTRVKCRSALWHLAGSGLDLRSELAEWVSGATELLWTSGGTDLIWGTGDFNLYGVPGSSGGWFNLAVEGLPPNSIVARPSERITVMDGSTEQSTYAMRVTRSDGDGNAVIRVLTEITISGLVSIGSEEEIVFEAVEVPEALQSPRPPFNFTWELREAFADAYDGGFTEVDPWH